MNWKPVGPNARHGTDLGMLPMIGIIDYRAGNSESVAAALAAVNIPFELVNSPECLAAVNAIVSSMPYPPSPPAQLFLLRNQEVPFQGGHSRKAGL